MKLPINLDKLLRPLFLFLLIALLVTGAIYAVLNDEQRAKEASHAQKDSASALTPSSMSTNKEVTWAEAGKQLLALEEKREVATQLFQENFKKTVPKIDAPKSTESQGMKSLGVGHSQPIVIADPMDALTPPNVSNTASTSTNLNNKKNKKKTKKRKSPICCPCPTKKAKRKKTENYCG